ncbi:hypothetical protein PDY_13740 [Photobacterium damselae subsp. damselae]|uniref:hypothetical protein n=1 Tax=Photobacterium damselae TaxID=38293 RepID=UPI00220943A0|nr:hypothetical protein [Photobacterium damselae]BDR34326.1 hypothetical protein PDY_13740 [Photobacterium damselae subsp. damselae]
MQYHPHLRSLFVELESSYNREKALYINKKNTKEILKKHNRFNEYSTSYVNRLQNAIINNSKISKLVICGLKAQCFFEVVFFPEEDLSFSSNYFTKTIFNRNIKIKYVYHPSPKNKNYNKCWVKGNNENAMLRNFILKHDDLNN